MTGTLAGGRRNRRIEEGDAVGGGVKGAGFTARTGHTGRPRNACMAAAWIGNGRKSGKRRRCVPGRSAGMSDRRRTVASVTP